MPSRRKRLDDLIAAATERLLSNPNGDPAAVSVTFRHRAFVVPTGEGTEDATAVRHLLSALFLHPDGPPDALRRDAERVALAVLRLGDYVSARAGLTRCGDADSSDPARVGRSLTLSSAQIASITGAGATETLASLSTEDLDCEDWLATPLLRDGNAWVLAAPRDLLVALRHRLIVLAEGYGWRDDLADRLADAYLMTIPVSLRRLGWAETNLVAGADLPGDISAWDFDSDAMAVVTVLFDDLVSYDLADPDGWWRVDHHIDAVASRSHELVTHLMYGEDAPKRVMHLVVLAGVGRPCMWFSEAPDPVLGAPHISFCAGDLETVGFAERGDPLALWRYALDADRTDTRFMCEDPLEQFALWRANSHSFYLGDGRRPTMVPAVGHAGALRTEVARNVDRHGVVLPGGRRLLEVVRRFDRLPVPIYRSLQAGLPGVIVDQDGLTCWVRPVDNDPAAGGLVDAVAFWLWQLADETERSELEIEVAVGHPLSVREPEPGRLEVCLDPARMPEFQRPDNAGERELVRALLRALTGKAPDSVVERIAPLGFKKMIVTFSAHAELALSDGPLPPTRLPLRESDDGEAMDELGLHFRRDLGLVEGPVAAERRGEVVWAAVQFHLGQLTSLIATLSPEGLLETLVAVNERLLYDAAHGRRTVATQMACFGEAADVQGRLRRDLELHAAASSALRFVIECIAAQPPSGIRPLTLSVQDRLVALAFQVISRGGSADAIREGLDDAQIRMLPSERLGISRDGRYFTGRERYAERFSVAEIRRSHEHFPTLWDEGEPSENALADAAMLDDAATHEWGATLTEIFGLFDALVEISEPQPAMVIPLDLAVDRIATMLDWEPEKVSTVIRHFALEPRGKLLSPDSPFGPHDVYPWRYGRRLSAVRRPLLIRPAEGGPELVYGFRAVDTTGQHLVHEIETARLKVESGQMQQALTAIRQRRDLAFNQRIADLYRAVDGLRVEERVKTVGKLDIARPNGDLLGDIDVLVADPSRRVIEAVDTKNLAAGRTPIEVAREIKRTFQSEGSKKAAIEKHAERAAWLRDHLSDVLDWLGLSTSDADEWRVEPSIVVDEEIQAPFIHDLAMPVTDAATLADSLARRAAGGDGSPSSSSEVPTP